MNLHFLSGNSYYKDFSIFLLNLYATSKYFYCIYIDNKVVSIVNKKPDQYNVLYLYYDSLGSVDTITDNQGVVKQRITYKPFSEKIVTDFDSLFEVRRGYTSHEHIEEFDLIHMNGRVYDSIIGRFISADPNIFYPFDTQDFNRYSYTKNNSLKYVDPSGYGWGDNDTDNPGDFSNDYDAGKANDNQSEENDFNGSNESGDGSGDSFEDRTKYDSRINEHNRNELSRLNLQYKVDKVTKGVPTPTLHSVHQKINRNVKTKDELDAIKNALDVKPTKYDKYGRPSYRNIGEKAEVAINPDTNKIVSVNATSSKKAARLERRNNND
ncbi:RHS repeat domain-containing protein [Malaciobacter sp. WC5094]